MDAMMPKRIALLALAYAVFGWLGLQLAIPPGYATAIFPASGLALAALLTWGLHYAPGVWIGSFILNAGVGALAIGGLSTTGIAVAASIAVGSTLQAVVSAWLVRQWVHQSIDVEEAGAVFRFLVVGGPLGCLISPAWGVTTLWIAGVIAPADVLYTGLNWWVGDSIGVIVVAPLALMVLCREADATRRIATVAVPSVISLALVIAAFVFASSWEHDNARARFHEKVAAFAQDLKDDVDDNLVVVASVRRYLSSAPDVSRCRAPPTCRGSNLPATSRNS